MVLQNLFAEFEGFGFKVSIDPIFNTADEAARLLQETIGSQIHFLSKESGCYKTKKMLHKNIADIKCDVLCSRTN